jgi:hypothetical protein
VRSNQEPPVKFAFTSLRHAVSSAGSLTTLSVKCAKKTGLDALTHGVLESIGRQNAQNHFELAGSYA